ncbi:hypothetical protein CIN_11650 [Commensalibacter intestini A911]|uniref:Uncharacterized protein n=1 Tax=Commensalibacter intestini A911 TaxID=1088868 RepID=G6F112_9PROT|nr:hypothetical protein CIN_11650 [Commensalibacter intestini A911]
MIEVSLFYDVWMLVYLFWQSYKEKNFSVYNVTLGILNLTL